MKKKNLFVVAFVLLAATVLIGCGGTEPKTLEEIRAYERDSVRAIVDSYNQTITDIEFEYLDTGDSTNLGVSEAAKSYVEKHSSNKEMMDAVYNARYYLNLNSGPYERVSFDFTAVPMEDGGTFLGVTINEHRYNRGKSLGRLAGLTHWFIDTAVIYPSDSGSDFNMLLESESEYFYYDNFDSRDKIKFSVEAEGSNYPIVNICIQYPKNFDLLEIPDSNPNF